MLVVAAVVGLTLYALRQNINLFYTPQELIAASLGSQARIRLGGFVRKDSIEHSGELTVSFIVTDFKHDVPVLYNGILPDLFREEQGVVALGIYQDNIFRADQILAKHDENYRAPELENIKRQVS